MNCNIDIDLIESDDGVVCVHLKRSTVEFATNAGLLPLCIYIYLNGIRNHHFESNKARNIRSDRSERNWGRAPGSHS